MRGLQERVALVTGAASGIGLACAERLAGEGATVCGIDVQQTPEWDRFEAGTPGASLRLLDVRNEGDVASALRSVTERQGTLDVVVNAAGVAGGGPVHLLPAEEWDRVIDINLKGTFLVCKHALEQMVPQRSGSIVNIASIEGIEGTEGGSVYNASKGGVVLLTKNMAIDYGRLGIRVNCICPGFIDTPLLRSVMDAFGEHARLYRDAHMLGRFGRSDEIGAAAAFLASEDASFVTGHALVVDGGFTAGTRLGVLEGLGL